MLYEKQPPLFLSPAKIVKVERKTSKLVWFCFAETHPILSKDAERRAQNKQTCLILFCRDASYLIQRCRKTSAKQANLFDFVLPRRIPSYPKMPKDEHKTSLLVLPKCINFVLQHYTTGICAPLCFFQQYACFRLPPKHKKCHCFSKNSMARSTCPILSSTSVQAARSPKHGN